VRFTTLQPEVFTVENFSFLSELGLLFSRTVACLLMVSIDSTMETTSSFLIVLSNSIHLSVGISKKDFVSKSLVLWKLSLFDRARWKAV
jgi:hypothetical protein